MWGYLFHFISFHFISFKLNWIKVALYPVSFWRRKKKFASTFKFTTMSSLKGNSISSWKAFYVKLKIVDKAKLWYSLIFHSHSKWNRKENEKKYERKSRKVKRKPRCTAPIHETPRYIVASSYWTIFHFCFFFSSIFSIHSDSSISTRVDMLTPAVEVYKPPLWHKDETIESNLGIIVPSTSSEL